MIQAHDLCLSFGSQKIFNSLSFTFNHNQRIGLVGNNGSGKTTLFKIIAGMQQPESGSIATVSKKKLAYLPQEVTLVSDKSVIDEAITTFGSEYADLIIQEEQLSEMIAQGNTDDDIIEQYSIVCNNINELGLSEKLSETKKVLHGLGFSQEQMQGPVNSLSVGWRMRLVLAKLLLQKADFYLFDEPTNHLDIFAKEWFLQFLKEADCGFLLVSHERYFLDELCDSVLELERGNGTLYKGNYSSYVVQKKAREEAQWAAYVQQQKEITRKEETINRFKASASRARSMQSMMKSLDKIERVEPPAQALKKIDLKFGNIAKPGRIVLQIKGIQHSFDNKLIFKNASFIIERDQKVALVAANGVGKTTLFNVISGKYSHLIGSIELGYNVECAIFEQDQYKALNPEKTILEEVSLACGKKTEAEIRGCLGAFLFSGDDVNKKIKVLSGGERNRVAMAKVLLQNANFLMLDEPTNHLDIQSKEMLLKALQDYPGTILFVSHDRDFVNDLADHIIELTPQATYSYEGNYDSFMYQKNSTGQVNNVQMSNQKKQIESSSREQFELKKMSKRLEEKIDRISKKLENLHTELAKIEYGSIHYNEIKKEIDALSNKHDQALLAWEDMQQQLDS